MSPARLALLPLLAMPPCLATAQVAPEASRQIDVPGFHLPSLSGSMVYAINASESLGAGYYTDGDPYFATDIYGLFAYISPSRDYPFSAVYSGGVLVTNTSQPNSVVQNLALSQVVKSGPWMGSATDMISYLPLSPTAGFSGIAGLGDLALPPIATGPVTGQAALTGYAPRVTNTITGSESLRLNGRASIEGAASFVLQRFTGDNAGLIDSNQTLGVFGGSYLLDPRSSVSGNYTVSRITFSPDLNASAFHIQSANFGYSRELSPVFSFHATLGPQWVSTDKGGSYTSVDLAADLGVIYLTKTTRASASYVRGTNNGFGVVAGGFSDSFSASANRTYYRMWNTAVTLSYTRTTNPPGLGLTGYALNTLVPAIQFSRAITRDVSTYGSYTAQHQSADSAAPGAFRGLFQIVAFGVTYAPRSITFGDR